MVLALKDIKYMYNLDLFILEEDRQELLALLDEQNITWQKNRVIQLTAAVPDIIYVLVQGGLIGGLVTVIVKWLDVKKGRIVKIVEKTPSGSREIEITGLSVSEINRILEKTNAQSIVFKDN